jgi:threonine/homoserine/homoserine lactone efflux protein
MMTHNYTFTLSKWAGVICLVYAGLLMFWLDTPQFEEGAKWGAFGMAIFSVKNFTSK